VGSVERVMLDELADFDFSHDSARPIPVLIRLEPARLERPDTRQGVDEMHAAISSGITHGLRATLSTGSLITGGLYVSMDFFSDAPPAEMREFAGRPTIPTIPTGLGGLEQRLSHLLDTVNAMPLEETVEALQGTLASLNSIVASEGMQSLPDQVEKTLDQLQATLASYASDSELQERLLPTVTELERTLSSLRQMLDTLDQQPNALIFNRDYPEDPRPPAGRP
jgi:paraquat-inducible protein B